MTSRALLQWTALLVLQAACAPSLQVRPDTLACADTGWRSQNLLSLLHDMVTSADSEGDATRATYHLDYRASIVLIRAPEICAQGAAAYSSMAGDTGARALQRRVLVARVGDKYAVDDPYTPAHAGEFEIWAIFDKKWQLLAAIAD